ncbi:MAG TPA: methyltransferase domain-containing protein [Phycisphaerales bacterium]|nr:methyltransferase domain-containing protein [Phycisphaerales bacterium]
MPPTSSHQGFTLHALTGGDLSWLNEAAARAAAAKPGQRSYFRLPLPSGGEAFVKVYTRRRKHSLLRRLGQSRAAREAAGYAAFAKAAVRTPELLAWGERRKAGLWDASFIATRFIEAPSAADRFANGTPPRSDLTDCLEAARFVGALHAKGIAHGDPGASNFLMTPGGITALDPGEQGPATAEAKAADAAQLVGSVLALGASQAQSEQVLRAYTQAAGPLGVDDRTLWRRIRHRALDELKRRTGAKVIGGKHSHDALHATLDAMPPAKVLDAPCGEGLLSEFLRYRGWEVHTADIDPGNMRAPGHTVATVDLNRALSIPDASYDVVVSANALHRLFNPGGAVREFHRILRPGGALVLNLNNYASIERRLRFMVYGSLDNAVNTGACQQSTSAPEAHVRVAFLIPSLVPALKEAGFTIERVTGGKRTVPQTLLLPAAWLTAAVGMLVPRRSRDRNALSVNNSMAVLGGGNYVVVVARKR